MDVSSFLFVRAQILFHFCSKLLLCDACDSGIVSQFLFVFYLFFSAVIILLDKLVSMSFYDLNVY